MRNERDEAPERTVDQVVEAERLGRRLGERGEEGLEGARREPCPGRRAAESVGERRVVAGHVRDRSLASGGGQERREAAMACELPCRFGRDQLGVDALVPLEGLRLVASQRHDESRLLVLRDLRADPVVLGEQLGIHAGEAAHVRVPARPGQHERDQHGGRDRERDEGAASTLELGESRRESLREGLAGGRSRHAVGDQAGQDPHRHDEGRGESAHREERHLAQPRERRGAERRESGQRRGGPGRQGSEERAHRLPGPTLGS